MRPRGPIDGCRSRRLGLLQVVLDGPGVACLGVVRVATGLPQRAALTEQVPAPVQLDLDVAEPLPVLGQARLVDAVLLLVAPKRALLGDQTLDARGDALVGHGVIVAVRAPTAL